MPADGSTTNEGVGAGWAAANPADKTAIRQMFLCHAPPADMGSPYLVSGPACLDSSGALFCAPPRTSASVVSDGGKELNNGQRGISANAVGRSVSPGYLDRSRCERR
jgi:hypothetical protein